MTRTERCAVADNRVLDANTLDDLADLATEDELLEFAAAMRSGVEAIEPADPAFRERLRQRLLEHLRRQLARRKH